MINQMQQVLMIHVRKKVLSKSIVMYINMLDSIFMKVDPVIAMLVRMTRRLFI